MNRAALAEDAISIRRLRARGVPETIVRRQLATVPAPATRRFLFVRRVVLRVQPDRIGHAMTTALHRLVEESRSDILSFSDFPAVAVACARAALSGGLGDGVGGGWHWRALGLPRGAGPGEALGTLLCLYPLEAGAAIAALAEAGLLAPVWRDLSEPLAARLTYSLAAAGGFTVPSWPDPDETTVAYTVRGEATLARAAAFWRSATRDLPRRHEAIRTAATLALLRWSPMSLRSSGDELWSRLLARIAGVDPPPAPKPLQPPSVLPSVAALARDSVAEDGSPATAATAVHDLEPGRSDRASGSARQTAATHETAREQEAGTDHPNQADPCIAPILAPDDEIASHPHGEIISTQWGGVLFLINALNRLDIAARLEAQGADAPSGWRLLCDLGRALGMPADEPLADFLAAQDLEQDLDSIMLPSLLAKLLDEIEALYAPFDAWPAPLAQPALLLANETHLDLDLLANRVDIDIRRVGLDIDPGWVPWLGRIVSFRYPNLPTVHFGEG